MYGGVVWLVTWQGVVDHEKASIYHMVVVARDQGHDPLSSEATVVVRIDDINDNAPSVTIRTLHGSTSTELPESSAVGSFVAHVSVLDQDSAVVDRYLAMVNQKLLLVNHDSFVVDQDKTFR